MLCQNCQKRIANVHLTQIINNKKIEAYLCEQCAKEKGHLSSGSPLSISDFFSGIMGFGDSSPQLQSDDPPRLVCDKCGMTYEDFQRTGRLGCDRCYQIYSDKLKPLLKRLHGSTRHNGKIPLKVADIVKVSKEIETLKELLNKAVQNEEYEKAADIRDKIRGLESTNK